MQEVSEMKLKSEADLKALTEKHQAEIQQSMQQSTGGTAAAINATMITSAEKKELMDALELLKSENQNLQSKISGDAHGAMP